MVTILTSVTKNYLPFARVLYKSMRENCAGFAMVCETINFKSESDPFVQRHVNLNSTNEIDVTTHAFTQHAFLLRKIRRERGGLLIAMNADAIIRKPLDKLVRDMDGYDIGARRKTEGKYWNGILAVSDTPKGHEFTSRYARLCDIGTFCGADQMALSAIAMCDSSLKVLDLGPEYMDFKCKDDSYVWFLKGNDRNARFYKAYGKYGGNVVKNRIDFKNGTKEQLGRNEIPSHLRHPTSGKAKKRRRRRRLKKKIISDSAATHLLKTGWLKEYAQGIVLSELSTTQEKSYAQSIIDRLSGVKRDGISRPDGSL